MNRHSKAIGIMLGIVILLSVIGCPSLRMSYTPNRSLDIDRARAIIIRVIQEQPANVVPGFLEVTDDYIQTSDFRIGHVAGVMRNVPTTIYFTSIGSVKLYRKRGVSKSRYAAFICDKGGAAKYKVYTYDRDHAEFFADAVASMVQFAEARGDPLFVRSSPPDRGCGLGVELALLLPLPMWLWRRRNTIRR